MKLSYPAIFYPWDEGEGFTVEVPDLPGCITEGSTMADAIFMAEDAASGWVLSEMEDGKPVPKPSAVRDVKPRDGGIVSLIALDMDAYADKYGEKAVRKNVTIPAWLNTFAEEYHINFSKSLQNVLTKAYEDIRREKVESGNYELHGRTSEILLKASGIEP
jgi:predicted RNase H-like HicB family nuclease